MKTVAAGDLTVRLGDSLPRDSAPLARHFDSALNLLLSFTGPDRRILKVESYNKAPASEGRVAGQLAELGFVRDYLGMAYYAI